MSKEITEMDQLLSRALANSEKDTHYLFSIHDENEIKAYLMELDNLDKIKRLISLIVQSIETNSSSSTDAIIWLNVFMQVKPLPILFTPVIQNMLRKIWVHYESIKNHLQLQQEYVIKMNHLVTIANNKETDDNEELEEEDDLKLFVDDSDYEMSVSDQDSQTIEDEASREIEDKDEQNDSEADTDDDDDTDPEDMISEDSDEDGFSMESENSSD